MGWLDNITSNLGKGTVEEAHASANDLLVRIDPLLHGVMNRAGGILHGLLDRLDGCQVTMTLKIPSIPKATAVNQDKSNGG